MMLAAASGAVQTAADALLSANRSRHSSSVSEGVTHESEVGVHARTDTEEHSSNNALCAVIPVMDRSTGVSAAAKG